MNVIINHNNKTNTIKHINIINTVEYIIVIINIIIYNNSRSTY